jgi:hypothetical protein
VGRFWQPNIEWRDVLAGRFFGFAGPGWGKIVCHFLVRLGGSGNVVVSCECRTATMDPVARSSMAWHQRIIRLFVAHIMRPPYPRSAPTLGGAGCGRPGACGGSGWLAAGRVRATLWPPFGVWSQRSM